MPESISPLLSASRPDQAVQAERDYYHNRPDQPGPRPLVSLVVPAYNEALIMPDNLIILYDYMQSLEWQYDWEMIIINDGSKDDTSWLADEFARLHSNVTVVHHRVNRGLGQALKTGFSQSQGDYIVVVDLDLSYAPDHIEHLLHRIQATQAGVVVASPYMEGGSISNVPWFRKILSVWANRFLAVAAHRNLATLTGMVRVYDANLLRSLNLRSNGMGINPEIIHKALLLLTQVEEIPAHLHWRTPPVKSAPAGKTTKRKSSMKIIRHTWDIIFSGFLLRPVMFFIIPSLMFLGLSLYANAWALIHCWTNYQKMQQVSPFPDVSDAVAHAFAQAPHTFFIGGITLMLAIQLFSLGVLSLQNKSYFEELFFLGTAIYRKSPSRGE
jgi:glycosyltransferase involved in cell wall biosynthesis